MITLFACPKPFRGHTDVIQRNAIKSWTILRPRPEIILVGDDEGVAEICREFELIHVAQVEKNEYGTPLVRSVFHIGQDKASHPIVCYVNADIILMSGFLATVDTVASQMSEFLIVAQRWDVDLKSAWDFASRSWETALCSLVAQIGVLHDEEAMDFFVFPRGMFTDIPPFAIGRMAWDNWLMWRARSTGIPVVDVTPAAVVVHQNHGFVPGKLREVDADGAKLGAERQKRGEAGAVRHYDQWVELGPEARHNRSLAPDEKGNLHIWAATWMVDAQSRLQRRPLTLTPAYLKYQLKWVIPLRWPWFGKVYRNLSTVWHTIRDEATGFLSRR